jgi:hypothetical protein
VADDVASEVFARAVALWPRFDPDRASLRAWLFGIAANICRETTAAGDGAPPSSPASDRPPRRLYRTRTQSTTSTWS